MAKKERGGRGGRKLRTREHVLEDLSENFLERKVLLRRHLLRRPSRDYGVDVIMFHFSERGELENGEVRIQLKSTDSLRLVRNGESASFSVRVRDLHQWSLEIHPFFLIVYDGQENRGFWLHVQAYVDQFPETLDPERSRVNVRIPTRNLLTLRSVDTFRKLSLETIEEYRGQGGFPNAPK